MFKEIVISCAAAISYFGSGLNIVYAEPIEVEASGEYNMGEHDTIEMAKQGALNNAIHNASLTAGVQVKSFVEVKDYQVTASQIQNYTDSLVKVKKISDYKFDSLRCSVSIVALVEIDEKAMDEYFKQVTQQQQQPQPQPEPQPQPVTPQPQPQPQVINPPQPQWQQPQQPVNQDEEWNGHVYRIVDGLDVGYRGAENYCIEHGGHLVYIESGKEQAFIFNMLQRKGTKNCYWIGGRRAINGKWYWGNDKNNPIKSFANWADGQPDNYTKNENMLMMYRMPNPNAMSTMGQWNDIGTDGECNGEEFFGASNFGFICEWDSPAQVR